MPRILRNYLISFAIIGVILLIAHLLDTYFQAKHAETQNQPTPSSEQTESSEQSSLLTNFSSSWRWS